MNRKNYIFLDSLYGTKTLSGPIAGLVSTPAVQRLREIRQSNIDSLGLPGFSNCSRYEHALGTWCLAKRLANKTDLSYKDALALEAAAILHDSAISAFGHLIEEGFSYLGIHSDHEQRWAWILEGNNHTRAIGGIRTQCYLGRQAGIDEWASSQEVEDPRSFLRSIFQIIEGKGPFGQLIRGAFDLDNLDNVIRAALHSGIRIDPSLPNRLVDNIHVSPSGDVSFSNNSVPDLNEWLDVRSKLYEFLMFSEDDFIGKAMLLSSVVRALQERLLIDIDWIKTDRELIAFLLQCPAHIKQPIEDWLLGNLWPFSGIIAMKGPAPAYTELLKFSNFISGKIGRESFAYRIKDKRTRRIEIHLENNQNLIVGEDSPLWFIGLVSAKQKEFTSSERREIFQALGKHFNQSLVMGTPETSAENEIPMELFSNE